MASESTLRIPDGGHAQSLTAVSCLSGIRSLVDQPPLGRCSSHQGVRVSPSEKPALNRRQTPGKMVICLLGKAASSVAFLMWKRVSGASHGRFLREWN